MWKNSWGNKWSDDSNQWSDDSAQWSSSKNAGNEDDWSDGSRHEKNANASWKRTKHWSHEQDEQEENDWKRAKKAHGDADQQQTDEQQTSNGTGRNASGWASGHDTADNGEKKPTLAPTPKKIPARIPARVPARKLAEEEAQSTQPEPARVPARVPARKLAEKEAHSTQPEVQKDSMASEEAVAASQSQMDHTTDLDGTAGHDQDESEWQDEPEWVREAHRMRAELEEEQSSGDASSSHASHAGAGAEAKGSIKRFLQARLPDKGSAPIKPFSTLTQAAEVSGNAHLASGRSPDDRDAAVGEDASLDDELAFMAAMAEESSTRSPAPPPASGRRLQPCWSFLMTGFCEAGESCPMIHGSAEEASEKKTPVSSRSGALQPCWNFVRTGFCAAGASCPLLHGKGISRDEVPTLTEDELLEVGIGRPASSSSLGSRAGRKSKWDASDEDGAWVKLSPQQIESIAGSKEMYNYKTSLCKHVTDEGNFCPHADRCRYAHAAEDVQRPGQLSQQVRMLQAVPEVCLPPGAAAGAERIPAPTQPARGPETSSAVEVPPPGWPFFQEGLFAFADAGPMSHNPDDLHAAMSMTASPGLEELQAATAAGVLPSLGELRAAPHVVPPPGLGELQAAPRAVPPPGLGELQAAPRAVPRVVPPPGPGELPQIVPPPSLGELQAATAAGAPPGSELQAATAVGAPPGIGEASGQRSGAVQIEWPELATEAELADAGLTAVMEADPTWVPVSPEQIEFFVRSKEAFNYKSMACRHFEQMGKCGLGDRCRFAHGNEELKMPGEVQRMARQMQAVPPSWIALLTGEGDLRGAARVKTEICRHFERTGFCSRGEGCNFAHGEEELGVAPVPTHARPFG